MKAIVYERYGTPEVLHLKDIEKPVPNENEVLIKIFATTVTAADVMMRKAASFMGRIILGLIRPRKKFRIPGIELSGIIEGTGKNVRRFKKGDEIYGFAGFNPGTYAQYKCLPETASLAIKPANMTFEESVALVDGATTAYFFLKQKGDVKKGERVLINGASGSIGSFAVQLAKLFEAEVTGVCSTKNVSLVKSLGADKVIDYTSEDFTCNGEKYDIIFDTVGKSSFKRCKKSLNKNGRYLITTGAMIKNYILTLCTSRSSKRYIFAMSVNKTEALNFVREIAQKGQLKPVIDKSYSLEKIIEAHRYVEQGHKKGNVVVTVVHE